MCGLSRYGDIWCHRTPAWSQLYGGGEGGREGVVREGGGGVVREGGGGVVKEMSITSISHFITSGRR